MAIITQRFAIGALVQLKEGARPHRANVRSESAFVVRKQSGGDVEIIETHTGARLTVDSIELEKVDGS